MRKVRLRGDAHSSLVTTSCSLRVALTALTGGRRVSGGAAGEDTASQGAVIAIAWAVCDDRQTTRQTRHAPMRVFGSSRGIEARLREWDSDPPGSPCTSNDGSRGWKEYFLGCLTDNANEDGAEPVKGALACFCSKLFEPECRNSRLWGIANKIIKTFL